MDNYEEQEDVYSKFYNNIDNIINEDIAKYIYKDAIINVADDINWSLTESGNDFEDEFEWYDNNKEKLDFEAEDSAIEEIIRKIFEFADVNVNRLKGDDYLDFKDYIKEKYEFLNPSYE